MSAEQTAEQIFDDLVTHFGFRPDHYTTQRAKDIPMAHVAPAEDGSAQLTVNPAELAVLRGLLAKHIPVLQEALTIVESPEVRGVLGFLKDIVG